MIKHLKSNILYVLLLLATLRLMANNTKMSNDSQSIIGNWIVDEVPSKAVEFYLARDNYYYGKITTPGDKEYGKLLFKKIQYDKEQNTFIGIMTPPDKPVELDVTITIESTSRLKIVAKKFLMTRTIHLTKI